MGVQHEDEDAFRARVRRWLAANMPPAHGAVGDIERGFGYDVLVARHRELQRRLWDGRLAGICFPREYGGLGLGADHRRVFNEEALGYEMPTAFNMPTFAIVAATLLEFGTEAQLTRHIPAMLRGDELWSQFLSEPTGGSDVAGALTSAVRDGDEWVLNGAKVWQTFADHADFALCLARTDWDAPKHRGLTVFIVPVHQPGIEIRRIKMVNGSNEFCEEFLTDVRIPADAVLGEVNQGWTVGTRWMFHEKNGSGGGSMLTVGAGNGAPRGPSRELVALARETGVLDDAVARQEIGEAWTLGRVQEQLVARVSEGLRHGRLPDHAAGLMRLFRGVAVARQATIARDLCGVRVAAWPASEQSIRTHSVGFIARQVSCLGGGSTEMARNVISERLLGMPREAAADRDIPYRDVRRNARAAAR
jgi:alkylation response protein AidB-like acyl-CoA dehydrogenase